MEVIRVGGTVRLEKSLPNAGTSGDSENRMSASSCGTNSKSFNPTSTPSSLLLRDTGSVTSVERTPADSSPGSGQCGRVIFCDFSAGTAKVAFGGADDAAGGLVASTIEIHKIADLVAVGDLRSDLSELILSEEAVRVISSLFSAVSNGTSENGSNLSNDDSGGESKSSRISRMETDPTKVDVLSRLRLSILSCLACRAALTLSEDNPDFVRKLSQSGSVSHLVHNAMLSANVNTFVSYQYGVILLLLVVVLVVLVVLVLLVLMLVVGISGWWLFAVAGAVEVMIVVPAVTATSTRSEMQWRQMHVSPMFKL